MTEAQAIEALTQRWLDIWPTLQPSVPAVFRGELADTADTWVRVTFRPATRRQATMGSTARFEARGTIFVQLFAGVDLGARPLSLLYQSVIDVFESRALGSDDLVTFAASHRFGGDDGRGGTVPDDGRWIMSVVTIPFRFYEQRSVYP